MQASRHWAPPTGPLGRLSDAAREQARELCRREAELRDAARQSTPPAFSAALRGDTVAVIAEIKRRSPSKGTINASIAADQQAAAFAAGGARALSVLTEPTEFGGAPDDLLAARRGCALPLLKKDFHIHPVQLLEARALGASAALLIARALAPEELEVMAAAARELRLEVIVEIRDEQELERALRIDAAMIGVNNRNLETLVIDPDTCSRIIPLIPANRIAIAESGMTTAADVERAATAGADAVLIGSSLSVASDPAAALGALTRVRRLGRAS